MEEIAGSEDQAAEEEVRRCVTEALLVRDRGLHVESWIPDRQTWSKWALMRSA